jgi:hypothetical protein
MEGAHDSMGVSPLYSQDHAFLNQTGTYDITHENVLEAAREFVFLSPYIIPFGISTT